MGIVQVEGRHVIVIHIPRARRDQRPGFLDDDPWKGSWIRVNDGDRRLDRERVRRMMADADRSRPRDSKVLAGLGMDEVHLETLQAYRRLLASRNADHPFLREDDRSFLIRLGLWGQDREEGHEGLRLAGLLLFGEESAIRAELPRFFLDYQHITAEAEAAGRRWDDRVFPDGTWNANLLQFHWRVFPRLVEGLRVPFALDEGMVRRAETAVHGALREALVNAFIHADYETTQGIRIIRRVDGFEFRNPGLLLLPEEQVRRGGESECRNPAIQHAFTLIGLGERAGSGVPKILQAWRDQHWQAPRIQEDLERGLTTLRLAQVSFLPEEVLSALRSQLPRFSELAPVARLAIATARIEGRVTNRRMQEQCELHPRDLTFLLKDLVEQGFLVAHGERGGTWYTVVDDPGPDDRQGALPLPPARSPARGPTGSAQSTAQSPEGSARSAPPSEVDAVRSVASGNYASARLVRAAILQACRGRFLTTRELADLLNRKERTIQQNYLRPLIREGRIELRVPDHPTAPDQAYRTVEHEANSS